MSKDTVKKAGKLYILKIRSVQIYSAQSRRIKDETISQLFHQFSRDEHNHARALKLFLDSNNRNPSLLKKILHEMDSYWIGSLSVYLGKRFVLQYNIKREKSFDSKSNNLLSFYPDTGIFTEIINSSSEHIEKISEL